MRYVRHTAIVSVTLLAALATVTTTQTARAWDGPLCAFERAMTSPDRLPREAALVTGPMCPPAGNSVDPAPVILPSELADTDARRAYERATALRAANRWDEALLSLDLVDHAFPRIIDRIALLRGDILLEAGRPADALRVYEIAKGSPDSAVAALGRVGRVRALIRNGNRDAAGELTRLVRYYPELPEVLHLRLELAQAREGGGDVNGATRIYRDIDLHHPGSVIAARARDRMEAIRVGGVTVRPLSTAQRVQRAETLVSQGPMDLARREVDALLEARLTGEQRGRMAQAAARIARVEGRWEDAQRYLQTARSAPLPTDPEDREQALERRQDADAAATAREQVAARSRIAQLKGRTGWDRVPPRRLLSIVQIAARAGLEEELNNALGALRRAHNLHPNIAFEAGLYGSGLGQDSSIAALFAGVVTNPRLGTAARYHYARALERMGRFEDAEAQFLLVGPRDRSETGWYAMLSEQRLWAVRAAMVGGEGDGGSGDPVARPETPYAGMFLASLETLPDPQPAAPPAARREGMRAPGRYAYEPPPPPDLEALAARLAPLAEEYGEGYAFFGRAIDLLHLGQAEAASDEIHEAYIAWRDARGQPMRRTGLEAVYRGEERPRRMVPYPLRAQRRRLDAEARAVLVEVSAALGDEGTATGFAGWDRVRSHPRAYEALVEQAAHRQGLDPNLLLAVMRVESVYQRRIVSYAGAVGLMQIMPRTGRLIAHELGREDFTTADLLDPETNLEFAAWYLASLIERFDGRLPLAIASYNGGPHNVRRWMRDHGESVPLDAFVEHIPFTQTHRYVRRVLSHYAAYRGQQSLRMEQLALDLPDVGPDTVSF